MLEAVFRKRFKLCCRHSASPPGTEPEADPLEQKLGSKPTTTTRPTATLRTSTSTAPQGVFTGVYASKVPNIDVCGAGPGGVSCPGAGMNGYFYRCCSSAGHCGPKNNVCPFSDCGHGLR